MKLLLLLATIVCAWLALAPAQTTARPADRIRAPNATHSLTLARMVSARTVSARTVSASPQTAPSISLTPVYTYRVIAVYPHDATAFTQGLVFTGGVLYEGTGWYGASSLRRVDLETGNMLLQRNLGNEYFGEGIAIVGDTIYQLTWQNGIAFTYDRATFSPLGAFTYTMQGWGLTDEGQRLIMSDGSATLFFRDPATFQIISQTQVTDAGLPVNNLNELEYINGEVWANVWMTDRIARIDPATGRVTGWIDLTGIITPHPRLSDPNAVLNGIAYDSVGGRLFVTGKRWPALFEIEVYRLLYLPVVSRP